MEERKGLRDNHNRMNIYQCQVWVWKAKISNVFFLMFGIFRTHTTLNVFYLPLLFFSYNKEIVLT
jgi:hypothetical protein